MSNETILAIAVIAMATLAVLAHRGPERWRAPATWALAIIGTGGIAAVLLLLRRRDSALLDHAYPTRERVGDEHALEEIDHVIAELDDDIVDASSAPVDEDDLGADFARRMEEK